MTIAVAVKTGSALVFAADSKVTAPAFAGRDPSGEPQFRPQTYDNAIKVATDHSQTIVAMFAGDAMIGYESATTYFGRQVLKNFHSPPQRLSGRAWEDWFLDLRDHDDARRHPTARAGPHR